MSLATSTERIPPAPRTANPQQIQIRQIQERLAHSHYASLRTVGCEVIGDQILLSGSVSSFHMKQVAQALVGEIVGREKIKNRIQVRCR